MSKQPAQIDTQTETSKSTLDMIVFPQGHYVIRESEPGDEAYIILEGMVEVVKKSKNGEEIMIAVLGKNEIFGEMCLFEGDSIRSASVRVISPRAEMMVISKEHFQSQVNMLPKGVRNIMQVLIDRLRKADNRIVFMS